MRVCRAFEWVLAILAAAAPLPAQQEPLAKRARRPMVGTVVGGDERTIPGASVVVAHVPSGQDSLPARHHATATTDARGRFRVDVLAGVDYRVFAIGPPDEHGTRFVSEVHQTTANVLLTLRATTPMPVRTFRLEHAERWREFAPLRLRVLPGGAELPGYEQPFGDDGSAMLPPLPSGYSTFEVLTASGVLATMTLRSTGDVAMQAAPVWDVPIELVDDAGQPVVGAEVQQRQLSTGCMAAGLLLEQSVRQTHRGLGTSDVSGRLVARIPRTDDPFGRHPGDSLLLGAAAPGHRATSAGACGRLFEGTVTRKAGDESRGFRLVMARAAPPRVRLHWGGQPQAGARLLANGMVTVRSGTSTHTLPWIEFATTDEDGHATFANMPAGVATAWLTLAESPSTFHELFPAPSPTPCLLLPALEARDDAVLDVDLAKFRRLHLRVLDQNRAPAQTTRLVLVPADRGPTLAPAEFPVDPTGQWTALVPPGPWRAFAVDGEACTFTTLAVGGPAPQVLQFLPLRIVEGKVVDPQGQGLANAVCAAIELRFEGSSDSDKLLQSLLAREMRRRSPVYTKADGTFQLQLPNVPGCVPWICFQAGPRTTPSVAVEGPEPIELVIPGR